MKSAVATATFAAGCFWGTERFYKRAFGPSNKDKGPIYSYSVGYMAGALDTVPPRRENPGYKTVCRGDTGCAEVLNIEYDPSKVKFDDLVYHFFKIHEPTTLNRQHGDVGTQYRSSIMVHTKEQEAVARRIIAELTTGEPTMGASTAVSASFPSDLVTIKNDDEVADHKKEDGGVVKSPSYLSPDVISQNKAHFDKAFRGQPIVTTIEPATAYFPAEDYHQEYLEVNPDGYCSHRKYW